MSFHNTADGVHQILWAERAYLIFCSAAVSNAFRFSCVYKDESGYLFDQGDTTSGRFTSEKYQRHLDHDEGGTDGQTVSTGATGTYTRQMLATVLKERST